LSLIINGDIIRYHDYLYKRCGMTKEEFKKKYVIPDGGLNGRRLSKHIDEVKEIFCAAGIS